MIVYKLSFQYFYHSKKDIVLNNEVLLYGSYRVR